MKKLSLVSLAMLAMLALLAAQNASEAAVDLVTVPTRDSVQLTIYNSADITMVRERRSLTFKKGLNRIQFSWAGTLIDPTSLRLAFRTNQGALELIDTVFPPGRNDALQWNIRSGISGPAAVELSYFTSGITWAADYALVTNETETKAALHGYVRIINQSGEDYPNANVRLVVGTINLVEKIADLAKNFRYRDLKPSARGAVRDELSKRVRRAEKAGEAESPGADRPKGIVKEGLSEYFIFTIEGEETIPNGWQKRLNSLFVESVPIEVIYRLSERTTGGQVHKVYEFRNHSPKEARGGGRLGESPLPDGRVQIYTEYPNHDLTHRAAVSMAFAARGDRVKLDSGPSEEVRARRALVDYRRFDITVSSRSGVSRYVEKYRELFAFRATIENNLPRPVRVEIERVFPGRHTLKEIPFKWEQVDYRTMRYYPDVGPRERKRFGYEVVVEHGGP